MNPDFYIVIFTFSLLKARHTLLNSGVGTKPASGQPSNLNMSIGAPGRRHLGARVHEHECGQRWGGTAPGFHVDGV